MQRVRFCYMPLGLFGTEVHAGVRPPWVALSKGLRLPLLRKHGRLRQKQSQDKSIGNCGSEQRRDLLGRPQDLICSGPARPQLQRDDQTLQLPFLRRQLNASILWPGIPAKYPFSPNLHQTSQLFAGVAFAAISGASSSSTSCLFCVIQIERKECLKTRRHP